jgi:hypothetical protein
MLKNLILIRHLGSINHFWLFWLNMSSGHVARQNKNSLQKTECKNAAESQRYTPLIFSRHLEYKKKTFLLCNLLDQNPNLHQKRE